MTTLTIIFIIVATLVIFLYDAYALIKSKTNEYTISYIIATAGRKNPIIPFAFGLLIGHWFVGICIN